MAKRGVDLLLAHLKGGADSIDTALTSEDTNALVVAADPLVTVAAILIRMLRDATKGTVESALETALMHTDVEEVAGHYVHDVESLIEQIMAGLLPEAISCPHEGVALIAHEIAIGAANGISKTDGRHVNQVIADLRIQLKAQGENVQISDRDAARAAIETYAIDEDMQQMRYRSAFEAINYWNRAAYILHQASLREYLPDDCQDCFEALARLAVTAKSLSAGAVQLVRLLNLYPAWTLVRQLVEIEFVLWRFTQDSNNMSLWLHSTADERRQNWKPSKIYRDNDNEYRQKDYLFHCQLGGHPTPIGTLVAAQGNIAPRSTAALLTETTDHSWEAWRHLLDSVELVDNQCGSTVSDQLAPIAAEFTTTMQQWRSVDRYKFAISHFSDPLE
jgi:hypothetical protein